MIPDPEDILTAALGEILSPRYLASGTWVAGPQTPYQVVHVVLGPLVWGKHSRKTETGSQMLGFGPTPSPPPSPGVGNQEVLESTERFE